MRKPSDTEIEKIIKWISLNGKFKNYKDIEPNNSRLNYAIRYLLSKEGNELLNKEQDKLDKKWYINLNYKKYPQLKMGENYGKRYLEPKEFKKVKEKLKRNKVVKKKTPKAVKEYFADIVKEELKHTKK